DVGHQQATAELVGEMTAAENLQARARTRPLLIHGRRAAVLLREVQQAGEQNAVIRNSTGAVHDNVLGPIVEDVTVRVGEAERHINVCPLLARFVAEDRAIGYAARRAPGSFHLAVMERSLL